VISFTKVKREINLESLPMSSK